MRIRKFLLENEKGQQFNMNDIKENCLLVSPSELGYSYSNDYIKIGNSFIENNRTLDRKDPSGVVYFKSYHKCKEFINFIESAEKLKWVYIVPFREMEKTYYRDVAIKSFDKTEKVNGLLSCPVSFYGLSLWYEAKEVVYTINSISNEIRWDFEWNSKFTEYENRNITFENKGHTEAPFKLELDGEITNLKITIIEDGQEKNVLNLNGLRIEEGEKFIYNTKDTEQQIIKKNGNVETNLFSFLNPNFINFYKFRKGESTIRLEATEEITSGKLTIYMQYKAV